MKMYYYLRGEEKIGPFSAEELMRENINVHTKVWHDGLNRWIPIGSHPDLRAIFKSRGVVAPPSPKTNIIETPPRDSQKVDILHQVTKPVQKPIQSNIALENHLIDNNTSNLKPKTWLIESIIATVLCCLPFGIAGIVFASQVETKYNQGDYEGAREASRKAKMWTIVSAVVTLICLGLYFILVLIGALAEG